MSTPIFNTHTGMEGASLMQKHKGTVLFLSLLVMLFAILPVSAQGVINISDSALESFIRREIGKPEGIITLEDIAELKSIDTTT
jgi:CBS domain-containing protein